MPSFKHGKNTVFKITDTGDTLQDISDVLDDASASQERDTAETTAFGDGDRTYIAGLRDGTISVSGHFDNDADSVHQVLTALLNQDAPTAFEYGPQGSATDDPKASGDCLLTSYEVSGEVSGKVSVSAEFQISGGITWSTFS